ncbi:DinB family protein [Pedobacter sp. SYP-B3415]|uniref:DinB family protein n=1 Tax=Pedobacter sp. SYP-B3415 TaxID=2496641 RepID=UPI00101BB26F|nr:DinB family protein [Pedobacter sp. SYP-B3415]
METKATCSRLNGLIDLYDMQTDFFTRALINVSDEDAHKRLDTKANHIAWLAGSLVQQRYDLAGMFGVASQSSAHELFKNNQGIRDGAIYPSLTVFKDDWAGISQKLREALLGVDEQKLESTFEMMPNFSMTHYDLLTFSIYREANCIGQIALWRRLLGYEALKYD